MKKYTYERKGERLTKVRRVTIERPRTLPTCKCRCRDRDIALDWNGVYYT
jgi:hypothetical protein